MIFTGRVLDPGEFGLYIIAATYDAALIPPNNPQPSFYIDAGSEKAATFPPWAFKQDGGHYDRQSGEFSITLKMEKRGYYYVVFYLKEDPSSIPYAGGRATVSTSNGFIGGAQVIRIT
ncbi:MAG: hypothetical protein HQK97_06885 [Nitrospirae bacterium]|nr:hypothetical protein [Nitrospirota bacterium]